MLLFDTECTSLISRIDSALSEGGRKIYEKYAFGVKNCTDVDESLVLSDLKEILKMKQHNHDCFRDVTVSQIENIVKQYL